MGPDGNAAYSAASPGLAWNATENEYLVVWHGDTDAGELVDDELEIWGQRLSNTGAEVEADFRVSTSGPADGSPAYGAAKVGVAAGADGTAVAVWEANGTLGGLGLFRTVIWGRVLRQQQQQQRPGVYLPVVRR